MSSFPAPRRLLLAAAASAAICLTANPSINLNPTNSSSSSKSSSSGSSGGLFSLPFLQPAAAAAPDSFSLDSSLGMSSYKPHDLSFLTEQAGHTPRRLSFSSAVINLVTQVATSHEIRQLMKQWTGMMGEIFKGPDTSEASVPYYWKLPECVLTVDFTAVAESGVADAAKVGLLYTPLHNAIVLGFVEEAPEWIQVLKRPVSRMQYLHLPADCMVDENTTYSAFCTKPWDRCIMVRLDIHLTRITKQMMDTLTPIPPSEFIRKRMEEHGALYDDAVDILEAPTTVGRMLFDPLECIMHCRVQAAGPEHVHVFFNGLDHSLRVDAQASDNSWFRRKVIVPLGCGGTTKEDFVVTVYLQADGHYKVVVTCPVARATDLKREEAEYNKKHSIEIKEGKIVRPAGELKYGEHDPKDMYPHDNFIPFETMVVGHPY